VERQEIAPIRRRETVSAPPLGIPLLLVASADIEHDAIGNCKLAQGTFSPASLTASAETYDTVQVFNGRQKIWSGSRVLAVWPSFRWTASTPVNEVWYAQTAWSATRIRGVASSAIAAGATGTIGSVKPLDGHFASGNASVFLPTTYVSIEAGITVWAELVYDAVGGTSRWEAYSSDCQEAGG
jgi:hypothetical protein